jgi:hypothetical protein
MTDEELWARLEAWEPLVSSGHIVSRAGQDLRQAADRLKALIAENERLREALRVYAGPLEWTQEGGWGMFPVWADGYPGGVYIDDNTLDFGDAARAALEKQP